MTRIFSTFVILFIFWIVLSGIYTPFLLSIGLVCCFLIVLLAKKMDIIDQEGHPIDFIFHALRYWPWLLGQIIQSALSVAKIIIDPRLPISPTMIKVEASQKTEVGIVTFANSITLTPGTIAVEIDRNKISVHAITRENAFDLEQGVMNEKCTRFEGRD